MFTFLAILTAVVFVALLLVAAMRPEYSTYSLFELERRSKRGSGFKEQLERQNRLENIQTLLKIATTLLLVATIMLLITTFGWLTGGVLSGVVAVVYPSLARIRLISSPADAIYRPLEPHLLRFVASTHSLFKLLRDRPFYSLEQYRRFDSREELAQLVNQSGDVLTPNERALISSSLVFKDKLVSSVMTPKSVIDFIKKSEFLGPLVLDELSALGHSRLPVIDKNLNQIVGILHLRDLLSLDTKHSVTADKAMDKKVYYIHQDDSLEHALAAFLKTRHHLFIVINEERETVGLITLEDVIEAMIGRAIVDEDDIHADLRAVAKREGQTNNSPQGHIDL